MADDDVPPGFTAKATKPEDKAADSKAVDNLASSLAVTAKVTDGEVDDPDLALRLGEGLQENAAGEITTVTHSAADASIYRSATTFEDIIANKQLLQAIYTEMKFERPSKIQATTLPMILRRSEAGIFKDLIAQAHNGSGKTTCFVLAMLSRVDPELRCPQALCMCTTRELVAQNLSVLRKMAKFSGITSTSTSEDGEDTAGARGRKLIEQVIIGTHGRLKNWVAKRQLDVDRVCILVFDEADEMLKADAFADDSVRLIKTIRKKNPEVQLLLFSATFNDRVKEFAIRIAPNANQVFVPKEELSLDVISQYNVICPSPAEKLAVLKDMIFPNCEKLGQTMIFVRTKDTSRALHAQMQTWGYKITSIQGDMQFQDRDRVVGEFRRGETKILISTDVLSRGFDVSQVTLVVNYDMPVERDQRTPNYETYLHRIGRSGRFGRKGAAFNLITGAQDHQVISAIASYFQHPIPEVAWNNEDQFISVLNKAGLTDQVA
eukprot:GHRQ01008774.1.p1 GENE.GHRQ01008774.1~~GHRQ01008774.1.p1  ORF type:complete len:492 (+),score=257.21 GHRQ01008774.1:272-1747(+)